MGYRPREPRALPSRGRAASPRLRERKAPAPLGLPRPSPPSWPPFLHCAEQTVALTSHSTGGPGCPPRRAPSWQNNPPKAQPASESLQAAFEPSGNPSLAGRGSRQVSGQRQDRTVQAHRQCCFAPGWARTHRHTARVGMHILRPCQPSWGSDAFRRRTTDSSNPAFFRC